MLQSKHNYILISDFDEMMEEILLKYGEIKNNVMNSVEDIFFAADVKYKYEQLDKNEQIELNEFVTLYRHVEKERFDRKKVQDLFFSEADLISSDGEKALSLNKFASLSLQEGLFKKEKQVQFAHSVTTQDSVKNIDQLRIYWKDICQKIKKRLLRCNAYSQNFKDIIEQLERLLKQRIEKDSFCVIISNFIYDEMLIQINSLFQEIKQQSL